MQTASESSSSRRRVFVVENHAFFRQNLVDWLSTLDEYECCCQAESVEEAQKIVDCCKPDLILLDLTLNGPSGGFDFLRWLRSRASRFPVIVLSQYEESRYASAALNEGARGYVSKAAATEELHPALDAVVRGDCYVSGRGALPCDDAGRAKFD